MSEQNTEILKWNEISQRVNDCTARPEVLSGQHLPDSMSNAIKESIENELIETNNSAAGILTITNGSLQFYRFVELEKQFLDLNSIPKDLDYIFFAGSLSYAEIFLPNSTYPLLISPHYNPLGASTERLLLQKLYNPEALEELNTINPRLVSELRQVKEPNRSNSLKRVLFQNNLIESGALLSALKKGFPDGIMFIQLKDDFRRYFEKRVEALNLIEEVSNIRNGIGQTIISILPLNTASHIFKIDS